MDLMSERPKRHLAMLALQFIYAGFHVVSGVALNMGISKIVFLVYNNIIALLLFISLGYFLERVRRPELRASFLVDCFLFALVGLWSPVTGLLIAAFIERNFQAWFVHSGTEFFSVSYMGIVASGIAFADKIWCIETDGPLFETLVVAIMASNALG
ncbi:hypothetical protein NE237_032749 [Protea cynaroides]|uniref:Uncharacterized protein n=1 Tax=Protea cynaroides TaxID=273540 RepID=A0A9Q0R3S1_9MAGN|nr:hypothetical protein NE237_032749 [Protea cynaroides]